MCANVWQYCAWAQRCWFSDFFLFLFCSFPYTLSFHVSLILHPLILVLRPIWPLVLGCCFFFSGCPFFFFFAFLHFRCHSCSPDLHNLCAILSSHLFVYCCILSLCLKWSIHFFLSLSLYMFFLFSLYII